MTSTSDYTNANQGALMTVIQRIMITVSVLYDAAIGTSAFVISANYRNDVCLSHVKHYSAWLLLVGILHYSTIVTRGICVYKSESNRWVRIMLILRFLFVWLLWVIGIFFFTQSIEVYCEGPLYNFVLSYIVLQTIAIVVDCFWVFFHWVA